MDDTIGLPTLETRVERRECGFNGDRSARPDAWSVRPARRGVAANREYQEHP